MNNKYINIYNNLVDLTRNKNLYKDFKNQDTFSDRLIFFLLHFAFFLKIYKVNNDKKLLQEIYDYIFRQIELSIREIGYGDQSINKKMKDYLNLFYAMIDKIDNWEDLTIESKGVLLSIFLDNATNYEYALTEMVGDEVANKAITHLKRDGLYKKMPSEIMCTFMLTDLEFTYDKHEDSFVSTAELGIATIGTYSVFRTIPGRVELVRDRGRDELVIYFHLGDNHWYYFEYDTFFNFETNDIHFMEVWNKLKNSDKILENKATNQTLKMQVSRHGRRDDFVDRFRDFN